MYAESTPRMTAEHAEMHVAIVQFESGHKRAAVTFRGEDSNAPLHQYLQDIGPTVLEQGIDLASPSSLQRFDQGKFLSRQLAKVVATPSSDGRSGYTAIAHLASGLSLFGPVNVSAVIMFLIDAYRQKDPADTRAAELQTVLLHHPATLPDACRMRKEDRKYINNSAISLSQCSAFDGCIS